PHPASKARITWSPQFAGGPDASQKGLGQRMPAKRVVRSATSGLHDCQSRAPAIGYGIDDFPRAVHTTAAGVIFWVARAPAGAVHHDRAAMDDDAAGLRQLTHEPRLAQSWDHEVALDGVLAAGNRLRAAASARIRRTQLGLDKLHGDRAALVLDDLHGLS